MHVDSTNSKTDLVSYDFLVSEETKIQLLNKNLDRLVAFTLLSSQRIPSSGIIGTLNQYDQNADFWTKSEIFLVLEHYDVFEITDIVL